MILSLRYHPPNQSNEIRSRPRRAQVTARIVVVGLIAVFLGAACSRAVAGNPIDPSPASSRPRAEQRLSHVGTPMNRVDASCVPGGLAANCEASLSRAERDVRQLARDDLPSAILRDLRRLYADLVSVHATHPDLSPADDQWEQIVRIVIDQADVAKGFPVHMGLRSAW